MVGKACVKNYDAAYSEYVRSNFLRATQHGDGTIIFLLFGAGVLVRPFQVHMQFLGGMQRPVGVAQQFARQ